MATQQCPLAVACDADPQGKSNGQNRRGGSGKDVRQLFERQAALVSRVLRTRFGPLTLDRALARGQFRELTHEQRDALLAASADSRSSAR